jgi:hypothetical protein
MCLQWLQRKNFCCGMKLMFVGWMLSVGTEAVDFPVDSRAGLFLLMRVGIEESRSFGLMVSIGAVTRHGMGNLTFWTAESC